MLKKQLELFSGKRYQLMKIIFVGETLLAKTVLAGSKKQRLALTFQI